MRAETSTGRDEDQVRRALQRLQSEAGSHSPSVAQIDRELPGVVHVDACFLSNPYATAEVMTRLGSVPFSQWERMISHYPSQTSAVAEAVAPHLGVPAQALHLANGACEVIHSLLARADGPVLLNVPTFSAYYEFATSDVVVNRLEARHDFRVDLDRLSQLVRRHRPHTVVLINPNNPDGGLIPAADLVDWIERTHDRVEQIIVDESFSHFATTQTPPTLAGLVADLPNLVVVNSLSKNYGIAGLRLGYVVLSPERARSLGDQTLWNLNAFAEWFTTLLADQAFQRRYEQARLRYIGVIRAFFDELSALPGIRVHPTSANFALVRLDRPAAEVVAALLARHGVYVRDCADKRGLECGDRYLRVAARGSEENRRIVEGLRDVLAEPGSRTAPTRDAHIDGAPYKPGPVTSRSARNVCAAS